MFESSIYERRRQMVGNHLKSAKAEGRLTATPTGGAGAKAGLSDQAIQNGMVVA